MVRFRLNPSQIGAYSLNQIYAGLHWKKRQAHAKLWHWMVQEALRKGKVPKAVFQRPVRISIYYNDRLDLDNHGYIAKMIVDSLKGYLLQDDTRRYFRGLYQGFHNTQGIIVEVKEL